MLGDGLYKDLDKQRQLLGQLATEDVVRSVLQINARQLDLDNSSSPGDFYLDPHTKHYTGEKNVLKGWCSGIGRIDKVMHSDFIHTVDGHPVYFETTDNFLDLRERTFQFIEHFRAELEFAPDKPITVVIDRGIFGADVFERFLQQPHLHFITWEKDYRRDGWDEGKPTQGEFILERSRNHSQDLFTYKFSFQDHSWPKNPRLKRIIVRATNPGGRTIEVAILTDDTRRCSREIILLIFCRWVQENDFKYLDKHFGIDQIISYQAVPYEKLADEITDKVMLSRTHRSLIKQRQEENSLLKNLLWKRERAQRREIQRTLTITQIKERIEQGKAEQGKLEENELEENEKAKLKKQLSAQTGQQKRAQGNIGKWEQSIEKQHEKLENINRQLEETSAEESRLEQVIARDAVKMKGDSKRLMDTLKILARNLFYIMLGPFKSDYDNYRDDHVIFRSLTASSGLVEGDEKQVTCRLLLAPDYPPAIRRLLSKYLHDWNTNAPEFPDSSGRPVTLELVTAEGIQVALPNQEFRANH